MIDLWRLFLNNRFVRFWWGIFNWRIWLFFSLRRRNWSLSWVNVHIWLLKWLLLLLLNTWRLLFLQIRFSRSIGLPRLLRLSQISYINIFIQRSIPLHLSLRVALLPPSFPSAVLFLPNLNLPCWSFPFILVVDLT